MQQLESTLPKSPPKGCLHYSLEEVQRFLLHSMSHRDDTDDDADAYLLQFLHMLDNFYLSQTVSDPYNRSARNVGKKLSSGRFWATMRAANWWNGEWCTRGIPASPSRTSTCDVRARSAHSLMNGNVQDATSSSSLMLVASTTNREVIRSLTSTRLNSRMSVGMLWSRPVKYRIASDCTLVTGGVGMDPTL